MVWLIRKRLLCICEGFGHKILAQTWPNLWVTSGVPMSADDWIGMNHKVQAILDSFDAKLASLFFAQEKPPCSIFHHMSQFHKEKERVSAMRWKLNLHDIKCKPTQADLVLLSSKKRKWNGTDVMSHRTSAANPLWTSLAYDLALLSVFCGGGGGFQTKLFYKVGGEICWEFKLNY